MALAGDLLLFFGALFCFLGALGLVRMPDLYNRIQAGTKAATLGTLAIIAGVWLHNPEWWSKLIVLVGFILFTSPVGSSTLARAAYRIGIKPWQRSDSAASGDSS